MPIGPSGEKCPADVIANAALSMRIATGDAEQSYINMGEREGRWKGSRARVLSMSTERCHKIAIDGVEARWNKPRPTYGDSNG